MLNARSGGDTLNGGQGDDKLASYSSPNDVMTGGAGNDLFVEFYGTGLTSLPLVPRLVFLVVGPAVDVKLSAMQAGMFGRRFAVRFGPATFVVATVTATVVGLLILGPVA